MALFLMSHKIDWTTLPPVFAGQIELFNTNNKTGLVYTNNWTHVINLYNLKLQIDDIVPNIANYRRRGRILVIYTDTMQNNSASSLLRIQKLENWQSELLEFKLPITWGDFQGSRHVALNIPQNAWIYSKTNHAAMHIQSTQSGHNGNLKAVKLLFWYERI